MVVICISIWVKDKNSIEGFSTITRQSKWYCQTINTENIVLSFSFICLVATLTLAELNEYFLVFAYLAFTNIHDSD